MKHPKFTTTPEISKRMGKVKLKMGTAEMLLAKSLWHQGIRYRKNYRKIPGSPDVAITSKKVAIFIDGDFWHGKNWENNKNKIVSNRDYWHAKIEENIARDLRVNGRLSQLGWKVIRFWESDFLMDQMNCVQQIIKILSSQKPE